MRFWGVAAVAALMGCAGSEMQQHFEAASRCHYTDKNYPCAIEHYTWMIDHGSQDAIAQRAYARRDSGDRAGAIADANLAVQRAATMASYYLRGNILADLDGIKQIGFADANARATPPLDLAAAEADFTSCVGLAPRSPTEVELTSLIMCFWGRRDVRQLLGKDASGDDETFRRMACDQCNRGVQCFTDSGCTLNMGASGGGGGGGGGASYDSSGGGGGGGGEAGAWYYSWTCTGECSPGQLAIKGTEGPFPTEEGCNAVRNNDSRHQLVQQSGNVGSVGYCERR